MNLNMATWIQWSTPGFMADPHASARDTLYTFLKLDSDLDISHHKSGLVKMRRCWPYCEDRTLFGDDTSLDEAWERIVF
jgi:hypothetical protein